MGTESRPSYVSKGFRNDWLNDGPVSTHAFGFTDPRRPSWEWPDEEQTKIPLSTRRSA